MSAFRGAIADLIITALAARSDLDEAYECARAVLEELPDADREEIAAGLRLLGDGLLTAPPAGAGVVALAAAALVESGGPPGLALDPVLERLEQVLQPATAFVRACQEALRRGGDPREAVERLGEQVAQRYPQEALAWNAIETLGLAALAMLTREARCRHRARERGDLLARLRTLRMAHERAEQMLDVLAVPDGEELRVLVPSLNKGYLVEIEGVADIAQLHLLLAAELSGSPDAGWLPIPRPDPRLAAAARNQPIDPDAGLFAAVWDLTTARKLPLRPDDPVAAIEAIDGVRVLLLGPVLVPSQCAPVRRYEAMPGEVRVLRTLEIAEVRAVLETLL